MDINLLLPLVLVAISVNLQTVSGIQCWECNTKENGSDCGHPFNSLSRNTLKLDCDLWARAHSIPHMPDSCYKVYQYQARIINGKVSNPDYAYIISRGCGYMDGKKPKCKKLYGNAVRGHYCHCKDSLCNNSTHAVAETFLIFISLIIFTV